MDIRHLAAASTLAVLGLAACGGGSSGGGTTTPSNPIPLPTATSVVSSTPAPLSADTIGIAIPTGTIGSLIDPTYGELGGYTQSTYSQSLAFPPGTTVTLENLSSTTSHTLNVLSTSGFPANPTLSTTASSSNILQAGYASGTIPPNGTVSVVLSTAGTYYIGCAFHYAITPSMRDVIQVSANATPGPQATAQPSPPSGGGYGY